MRLLAVTSAQVSPIGGGGAKRMWHLIHGFEREGTATTIWTVDPDLADGTTAEIPGSLRPALLFAGRPRKRLGDKLLAIASPMPQEVWRRPIAPRPTPSDFGQFDAVIFMGPHATRLLPLVSDAGLPSVLDMHDVVDEALRSIARTLPGSAARWRTRIDSLKWRAHQRRLVRGVSLVAAVSERDAAVFRRHGAPRVVTHANGVDLAGYEFVDHSANRRNRLLMTGHFGYLPNIDAARWLSREIVPRLRARNLAITLRLVGRDVSGGPWSDGIYAEANVPDILPYFDAADVLIVPLRAGGGTRIKLIEAFAKGLPCVSTSIGCEGLPVENGVHLLVADTTDDLVEATLRLLADRELRARLARNARELVERRFDWTAITREYVIDLRRLARDARTAAPELLLRS